MSIESSFVPSDTLPTSVRHHLNFGTISLLKHAPTAASFPNHTVLNVYSVYDQHQRKMGLVIRARYQDEKAATWFAVGRDGKVTGAVITNRADAIRNLEIMFAAWLLTLGMSNVESPLL